VNGDTAGKNGEGDDMSERSDRAGTPRPDHTGPDATRPAGETPATGIEESDPNADSPVGLAGDLGVSSERPGPVRGVDEDVTYGTAPTHPDEDTDEAGERPPEQSAYDGEPEVHPDNDVPPHPRNPQGNPGHSGG
jgi:hypothetical protein